VQPAEPSAVANPPGQSSNPLLGAFLGLPVITPDKYEALAKKFESQDPAAYLPKGTHKTVVEGFHQQQKLFAQAMRYKNVTFLEHTLKTVPGGMVIFLHTSSRGTVRIDPKNPEKEPLVDYRAFTNPIDMEIMVEMIRFMRRYIQGQLSSYKPVEVLPGANLTTDAQLTEWLHDQANPSAFHPSGTAAKMPREWGGVVSEDLLVWGVKNLSVIDTSIFPTLIGATTSMTVYACAEKVSLKFRSSALLFA